MVYAKTPLGGPAQVLEYLSRYTHRSAIGNERIRDVNDTGVAFTVLPTGVKRIRHYGVLASACKGVKLAAARAALQMPAANPLALESAQAFLVRMAQMDTALCPCCKVGRLKVVASLAGLPCLPAPGSSGLAVCRGPP